MPADLRNALPGLIQEVLGMAPVFQFKTLNPQVIEVAPAKKSGLLRILGK
jgi:hypothetical protein